MKATVPIPCEMRELVEALSGPGGPEGRFDVGGRRVEFDAIVELLVRDRTPGLAEVDALRAARTVAAGCLGEQHLWRDLGLPDRATLRGLLEAYFAPFAEQNYRDMRWKRYIYRRLCRWEGFRACRAPSCAQCPSYADCFAPEE